MHLNFERKSLGFSWKKSISEWLKHFTCTPAGQFMVIRREVSNENPWKESS